MVLMHLILMLLFVLASLATRPQHPTDFSFPSLFFAFGAVVSALRVLVSL